MKPDNPEQDPQIMEARLYKYIQRRPVNPAYEYILKKVHSRILLIGILWYIMGILNGRLLVLYG